MAYKKGLTLLNPSKVHKIDIPSVRGPDMGQGSALRVLAFNTRGHEI